jgi:hypothetical protein
MGATVGLSGSKHPQYTTDLVGAAQKLGIRAGYDTGDGCFYLDVPEGSQQNWLTEEDVVVTMPDGREWSCWFAVSEDD